MQREERAIVTPAAKVLLVALLVTVARSESREEPAADFEFESGNALLNRLAALSLAELDRLAETGALKVVVSCAGDQLSWSLQALARKRSEQALLEYFVRHGAPRTLVRELFTDLACTDRRRSQEPTHRLRAGTPEAATLARARGNRRRLDPARGLPKTGAPVTTPSTGTSRAIRSRRSTRFCRSCRQSGPLRLVRQETGRRPRQFPGREPARQTSLPHDGVPSCAVVSPGDRCRASRFPLTEVPGRA